jgi:allantoin racemase
MKIWCQLPVKLPRSDPEFSRYYDFVEKHYNLVKRKDTEIAIKDVPTSYGKMEWQQYTGMRFFKDAELLRSVLVAEQEGFDGVSIACFLDPTLAEARQLLNIPVTGLAEASMHMAYLMGSKFAIITKDINYAPVMEEQIANYGMAPKAIKRNPVRALTLPKAEVSKVEQGMFKGISANCDTVIENFREVADGCIKDGAEVLIMGCGLLSPILMQAGLVEVDGAAMVEPMHASLKLTEMLVDLYKAKIPFVSRKSMYLAVPREDIAELLKTRS